MRASRSIRRFLLALFLLLIPATAMAQEWYQLYDRAVALVRKGQYIEAEGVLKKAVAAAKDIEPGPRVFFYGSRREPYFPDYYFGVIYVNTKRAREAVAAFQAAQKQGLPNTGDFREVTQLVTRAKDEIAIVDAKNVPPPVAPGPETKKPAPPPVPAGPTPAEKTQFQESMKNAATLLKQGNFADARKAANTAKGTGVNPGEADRLLDDINKAETAALEAEKRDLAAKNEKEIGNIIDQIEAAIRKRDAGNARSALGILTARAPDRAGNFEARIVDLERTIVLNGAERTAMQAFFAGNYQAAINAIAAVEPKVKGQLSARAYFYRACSLAAIALQSKSIDRARLSEAQKYFKAAAAAGREQFAKDISSGYISPKILQQIGAS